MASWKILVWVTLALCACGPQTFQHTVRRAEQRWENAICRSPRYTSIIVEPKLTYCRGRKGDYYGCYEADSTIRVSADIPPEKLESLLVHEMGHSLAPFAGHTGPKQGIMAAGASLWLDRITSSDIALLCKEYECPCRRPEKPSQ